MIILKFRYIEVPYYSFDIFHSSTSEHLFQTHLHNKINLKSPKHMAELPDNGYVTVRCTYIVILTDAIYIHCLLALSVRGSNEWNISRVGVLMRTVFNSHSFNFNDISNQCTRCILLCYYNLTIKTNHAMNTW